MYFVRLATSKTGRLCALATTRIHYILCMYPPSWRVRARYTQSYPREIWLQSSVCVWVCLRFDAYVEQNRLTHNSREWTKWHYEYWHWNPTPTHCQQTRAREQTNQTERPFGTIFFWFAICEFKCAEWVDKAIQIPHKCTAEHIDISFVSLILCGENWEHHR